METLHHIVDTLGGEMSTIVSSTVLRLLLAAILGGLIGLERELRHKPAGLRTNMFICFGAAMFTLLSLQISATRGDPGRIAAQIIPGIGFIGAGSILHARGSVTGLTTAATIFVVASVGMAAGGGFYVTAVFATIMILIALTLLGSLERRFELKSMRITYEVSGKDTESLVAEINRILDAVQQTTRNLRAAAGAGYSRVVFDVDCDEPGHQRLNVLLHQSPVFSTVSSLGQVEHE